VRSRAAASRRPRHLALTERVGRAMLAVAKRGGGKTLRENADINAPVVGFA